MSKVVDERVVEMRFDNQQFEKNAQTSISTLAKLKQSLTLPGASKGLEEVNSAAKKLDMRGLGSSIEAVGAKFSALQVMGVTALANITNSAVNAGKRMLSALTIDPVKTGFQEYETKINAVQTILSNTSNKGTTMSDVTKVLDELNLYADKTIYNFAEMTRNIGTFTAAGVGLKESASAIQGIANLAAASGSSSQQASTAMYQLSQALAAGTVKLQDWNSVVNAGMGGQKFQEALKATAREHGVAVDDIIKKQGSFRESLQDGWITADILNETLSKFTVDGAQKYAKSMMESGKWTREQADALIKEAKSMEEAATKVKTFTQLWDTMKESAQSGWAQTWEIIIGDFEKAKGRLSEVSDLMGAVIGDSSNRRNDLLEGALTSKWDILVKKMNSAGIETDIFQNKIKELSGTHKEEFQKMIEESDTFEEAVKKALSSGVIDKTGIKEALKSVTSEFSKLSDEELKNKGYTDDQIKSLRDLAGQADGTGGSIDDLISKIDRASGAELIWDSLLNILKSIIAPMGAIREAWDEVFPPNPEGIYNTIKAIKEFTDKILEAATASDTLSNITRIFKGIFSVIDIVWTGIKDLVRGARDLISNFTGLDLGILDLAASFGDFLSNLRNTVKETDVFGKSIDKIVGFLSGCIDEIKKFGSSLKENLKLPDFYGFLGFFKAIGAIAKDLGSGLGKAISQIGSAIVEFLGKVDFSKVMEMLNSGLFAGLLLSVTKFIKGLTNPTEEIGNFFEILKKNVTGSFDKVKVILDDARSSLEAYQNNLKADALLKIASAVGILAVALTVLSTIDSDKLSVSLGAIAGLFGELVGSMALLEKINGTATKPLSGFVGSLANISKTVQMAGLAVSVLILAGAMKTLSSLDWDGIGKGLVGVAGLVGILVAAAKLMKTESKSITKFAGQMIILSIAVTVLSNVAKSLSSMSLEELGKAGVGLFGIIAMLVGAAKIMNSEYKTITKFAGQMVLMSISIGALSLVAKLLSSMSWEELGKAGAGLLGVMSLLVASAKIMKKEDMSITKFAGQMMLMSAAIGALALIGKTISSMSWGELAKAGAGIFGLVTMLVVTAKIMDSNYGSITKFAGQMLLMSASLAVLSKVMKSLGSMSREGIDKGLISIGGSIAILAIGLNAMNGTLAGSAALMVAAGALAILTPVLRSLGSMGIENIFTALTTIAGTCLTLGVAAMALQPLIPAIFGLAKAFALFGLATAGIGAGFALIGIGLTTIAAAGTAAAASLVASIGIIITGFLSLVPTIIGKLGEAITAFCQLIGQVAPQIADAALQLVSSVLASLAEHAPKIADSLFTLLIGLINVLATRAPELVGSLSGLVVALINGLAMYVPEFIAAGINLVGAILRGIVDAIGPIMNEIVTPILEVIKGLIVGIAEAIAPFIPNIQAIVESVTVGVQAICAAFIALVGQIAPIINNITGLVQQLGNSISQILLSISAIIQGCGNVISQMLYSLGTVFQTVFAGIESVVTSVGNAIKMALDGIANVVRSFGDLIKSAFEGVADGIRSVGDSIKSVLDGISNVIGSIGEAALNAGTGFKQLAEGVKTITKLNLADMVTSLAAVAKGISDIASSSEGLASVGAGMQQIVNGIALSATAFNTMETHITRIVVSLQAIGPTALASISMLVSSVMTAISQAASIIASKRGIFMNAGMQLMIGLRSGIMSGATLVVSSINMVITKAYSMVLARYAQFMTAGMRLMTMFANGLRAGGNSSFSAVMSVVNGCANTIRIYYSSFYSAGAYLGEGLVLGISSKMTAAYDAGYALGQAAAKGEKDGQQSNSPSKLTIQAGKWLGEGLVIGMKSMTSQVYKAGYKLGDTSSNSITSAISRASELINSGFDATPTIRPVLDLSDIQAGAGAIGSMLNMSPSVGAWNTANAINTMMNQRIQNGDNDDVVSAINKLGKKLDNAGSTTTYISGITYDDGSNINEAVESIVRAAKIGRRM